MKTYSKLFSISVLTICMFNFNVGFSDAQGRTFKDISAQFWGYESILWAVDNHMIDGYPDDTFRPSQYVEQNEFIAMLIRAYQPSDFTPDTDSIQWSTPYISYWTQLGWHLIPSSHETKLILLSRGQVAQLMVNATGRNYTIDDSIQYLLDTGMAEGKTEKTIAGFKQEDPVTRAEAIVLIKRLKQYNEKLQPNRLIENILYENVTNHFTLQLPKQWEGKYAVEERETSAGTNVNFINKASQYGVLFTISIWTKEFWAANEEEIKGQIPISKIGETGDNVYLFHTPTDVQYLPSDEKVKEDYQSMFNDIKNIKATFELKK